MTQHHLELQYEVRRRQERLRAQAEREWLLREAGAERRVVRTLRLNAARLLRAAADCLAAPEPLSA